MSRELADVLDYTRNARNRYARLDKSISQALYSRYIVGRRRIYKQRRRPEHCRNEFTNDVDVLEESYKPMRIKITGLNDVNRIEEDRKR